MDSKRIDDAMANTIDFDKPFQELVNEYCWGTILKRPGLSRKIRSLITIAKLNALNRPTEGKLQIEGAVNNGCSKKEIREVLLRTVIYCGVPTGLDSFKITKEVLKR